MLNFNVIGAGAAGNKAVKDLIQYGYPANRCYFVNSTTQDIPDDVQEDHVLIFGKNTGRLGGCGKERSIGKQLLIDDMSQGNIDLDYMTTDANAMVVVGSVEGGSGSASIPILAKYLHEVLEMPVIICLFFGFHDDVRGVQNTIELCQELQDDYGIICIDNASFMSECNGNRFQAEKAANRKFVNAIKVLTGSTIIKGEQMIDDTDLFKVITTPGYMITDSIPLPDRIRTIEESTKLINSAITEHHFIYAPADAGAKRVGLIFNLVTGNVVDFKVPIIYSTYGNPYEVFISKGEAEENSMDYIVSGMNLPIDEIQKIYKEYMARTSKVNKKKDNFFGAISQLQGDADDAQFNMLGKPSAPKTQAKKDFFAGFGVQTFKEGTKDVKTDAIDKSEY